MAVSGLPAMLTSQYLVKGHDSRNSGNSQRSNLGYNTPHPDAAYGERNAQGRAQYEKHRHVLRHERGGVERVIRGLRYLHRKHPRRKRIKEVLGYFVATASGWTTRGRPSGDCRIGSGVVEAACKSAPG